MKINGKQTVKIRSGSIKFKNYFKQLALAFMVYADFESLLNRVRLVIKNITSYFKKISETFLAFLPTKLFVLMTNLVNQLFFTWEKCN